MTHIFITGASWKVIVIVRTRIWDVFIMSEEIFLLGSSFHLYFAHWVLGLNHSLPFTRPQTAQFSVKAQGPIYDMGPQPYNSLSKLWFFPLIRGEKWGFDFSGINIILSLTCTHGSSNCVSHDCYWCFEARKVSLIAPSSMLFPHPTMRR